MPSFNLDFTLQTENRTHMREDLIKKFISESPGTGKKNLASHYIYNVENYGNYGIILKRPTRLNKGFDFTVNIKGIQFKKIKTYTNPSHNDIINILIKCKKLHSNYNSIIKPIIQELYDCKNVVVHTDMTFNDFQNNTHPIDIILLAIKWLFIEQDCAYWNYSGREMFYLKLKEKDLV